MTSMIGVDISRVKRYSSNNFDIHLEDAIRPYNIS